MVSHGLSFSIGFWVRFTISLHVQNLIIVSGDASNLIGCLLTNQLPFQVCLLPSPRFSNCDHCFGNPQTWLATYFVIVDCSLVGQYLYYEGGRSTPPAYARGRRIASSRTRSPSRYRSRSSAAPHVAGTLVAHVGDVRHIPRATRRLSVEVGGPSDQLDDEAFNAASALTDSLNSESGHRPDHSRRVSWDVERPALPGGGHLSRSAMLSRSSIPSILHLTSTESIDGLPDTEGTDRGRTLRRDVEIVPESTTFRGDQPTVRSSRHGARTSAGVVFMGAWMIFGLGEVARRYDHGHVGFVLRDPMEVPVANEPASTERIIGRIFAWLCVSLYLTSRLPQIWKNVSPSFYFCSARHDLSLVCAQVG